MKKLLFTLSIIATASVFACGGAAKNQEDTEVIQAEITELEANTQAIQLSTDELDASLTDLNTALDSLDVLFPEKEED